MASLLFITGTDTGVGKTIATAALAARAVAGGASVAVYKPTQAGLEDGAGDIDTVRRLGNPTSLSEGIRLEHPMAPVAAARRQGVALPPAGAHAERIAALAAGHDLVLVEGAGGLLVELDDRGATLADVAAATPVPGAFIVVCRAALGTLNHTALTLEALARRGRAVSGLIIGAWPREPGLIEQTNHAWFTAQDTPLLGAIPEGAGGLSSAEFQAGAQRWLTPPAPPGA